MSHPYIAVLTTLVAFSLGWVFSSPLRRPRKLEALLEKVTPDRADRLVPFIEGRHHQSDMQLQEAIGGWRGILEMHKQAGYIASIAHMLANGPVGKAPELDEIVLATIYMRLITPICLAEVTIHMLFATAIRKSSAQLHTPWVSWWGFARLYCEMVSSMTAVIADNDGLPQLCVAGGKA